MSFSNPDNRNFDFPYQGTGFDAEVAHTNAQRRRGGWCFCGCCSGCLLLILLFILGIVVLGYSLFSGGVPLIVSEETTVIVEPLKSNGESVDFHEAIREMTGQNIQLNENAFMIIWRGYSHEIFASYDQEDLRRQYLVMCDQFGIDPLGRSLWSLPKRTPPTTNAQWLAEVKEGLDAVQNAVAKPHYFIPLARDRESDLVIMSQPLAIYAFHGQLSEALHIRADIKSASGDIAGAWQDTLASIRLFRRATINHAWTLTLGAKDNESLLTPVTSILPTLSQWTPEQLEQAVKDLESLPDWTDRKTMIRTIQFTVLDMLSATNDLPGLGSRLGKELPTGAQDVLQLIQSIGFDWNLVAKELNQEMRVYGELLEKVSGSSPDEQFKQLDLRLSGVPFRMPNEEEWKEFTVEHVNRTGEFPLFVVGRSKLVGAIAGFWATRMVGEMYRLQLMEESRCQALRLALTLERFHKEKGQYPDSLEELKLKPVTPDMHLQYEKRETGYRIENVVVQLEKR